MDIAVIINSFNRLDLLKECLGALAKWCPNSEYQNRCVIIIYDAGSTDGSIQWIKHEATKSMIPVHVILPSLGDDTSFAAGLNAGVEYAKKMIPSLQYLLFYETDNQILHQEALSNALYALQSIQGLAACGFTVRRHDGCAAGVGQPFPSLLNFSLGKNIVHRLQLEAISYKWQEMGNGNKFSEVDVVYTSPLLVRLDAWNETGGLDANIFPFSDCDVDWAKRLHMLGWKMGIVQTNNVIHDNKETFSNWSRTRALHAHRGRLRYFRRHYPASIFLIWPVLLMLRHSLELIGTVLFVWETKRRKHLFQQFSKLLLNSIRGYQ